MDKTLQTTAWSCLPKGFKEEVKKEYAKCVAIDMDDNPNLPAYAVESAISRRALLEMLFGEHNLTSDAEGEDDEMLTVSRKKVQELFNEYQELYGETKGKCHDKEVALSASHFYGKMCAFSDLFGSKCLPDEACNIASNVASSEPKPSEIESPRNDGEKGIYIWELWIK